MRIYLMRAYVPINKRMRTFFTLYAHLK